MATGDVYQFQTARGRRDMRFKKQLNWKFGFLYVIAGPAYLEGYRVLIGKGSLPGCRGTEVRTRHLRTKGLTAGSVLREPCGRGLWRGGAAEGSSLLLSTSAQRVLRMLREKVRRNNLGRATRKGERKGWGAGESVGRTEGARERRREEARKKAGRGGSETEKERERERERESERGKGVSVHLSVEERSKRTGGNLGAWSRHSRRQC
eukprot:1747962-Rhodomonas_salina.2